ncbi:hypothetical protein [Ornithinibacillus californiensis]|uniref:hypothetical protein n=1 Tax=Ornithinibacillus californiensis TaxID=161536 RepID=UPI00064DEF78|nr:hypothetical protein [Ornithinibacillus californiensis]
MKKLLWTLFLSLILLSACEDDKAWEPYSPLNTSSLMALYAGQDNYEQFRTLIKEGYDEENMKRMYQIVKQAYSDNKTIDTFSIVSFENGKTVLVHLTPQVSEDEEFLIQDIIEIPPEMTKYINDQLLEKYKE